jgi:hypothetical protein
VRDPTPPRDLEERLSGPLEELFFGRTPGEISAYFKEYTRAPDGERSFNAAFTFVVMDARSAQDETVLICVGTEEEYFQVARTEFSVCLW